MTRSGCSQPVEETMAIDDIDPADVFELHHYTEVDDY